MNREGKNYKARDPGIKKSMLCMAVILYLLQALKQKREGGFKKGPWAPIVGGRGVLISASAVLHCGNNNKNVKQYKRFQSDGH